MPASLAEIRLEIHVAGRSFYQSFGPGPSQHYSFIWDGRDAYGRLLQGPQPVLIRLGYRYGLARYASVAESRAAFGG